MRGRALDDHGAGRGRSSFNAGVSDLHTTIEAIELSNPEPVGDVEMTLWDLRRLFATLMNAQHCDFGKRQSEVG